MERIGLWKEQIYGKNRLHTGNIQMKISGKGENQRKIAECRTVHGYD